MTMNREEIQQISNDVKHIMATQLTETEVMIYLLVKQGRTFRDIVELPWGFTHETARSTFERAEKKIDKMAEAGLFSTEVKQ